MNNKKFNFESDNLIYVVTAKPGGQDGLDSSNQGGPVWAFTTEEEAKRKVGPDSRYTIVPTIANGRTILRDLRKKLSPIERLYLKLQGASLT